MPSLDTRLIKISSSDNSSPSSSDFIKVVLAEENRQYALKVLCETFSKVKPRSPPNPISSYAGLDNQSNPHSRMSTTTTAEDRNDNAVAPPLQLVNFSTLLKNTLTPSSLVELLNYLLIFVLDLDLLVTMIVMLDRLILLAISKTWWIMMINIFSLLNLSLRLLNKITLVVLLRLMMVLMIVENWMLMMLMYLTTCKKSLLKVNIKLVYTSKNLTTCSKSANKKSASCVCTACYKLSTSLKQAVNNL